MPRIIVASLTQLFLISLLFATNSVFAEAPPIKIGASAALSGKLAFFGVSQVEGLTLAAEELNAAGGISGRSVQIVVEDNTGDPRTAVTVTKRLLDVSRVDLLFTGFTHITQAIKSEVKRANRIMVYAASLGSIAAESPLFFRDFSDTSTQSETLAQAVHAEGFRRVGYLAENSDVCSAVTAGLMSTFTRLQVAISRQEQYDPGETDFKPLLLRIRADAPDALVFCSWRDEALLLPQLDQLGMIRTPGFHFFGNFLPVSDTPEMRRLFERNSAINVSLGVADGSLSKLQEQFVEAYRKRFGGTPQIGAVLAYDDLKMIASLLPECLNAHGVDQNCLANKMRQVEYIGVAGLLRFDVSGRSYRPDLVLRAMNGKWVVKNMKERT